MPDAVVIPAWADLLDQMMVGAEGDTAPELLKQLALTAVYRRAATITPKAKLMPELNPAPPETRPPCRMSDVQKVLGYHSTPLLRPLASLWFTVLYHRGKRIPHQSLPTIFALGKHTHNLIAYIARIIGERGAWMVANDKDYAYMRQHVWLADEDDAALLAKTLDEWKQDANYTEWMEKNHLTHPTYRENLQTSFDYAYNEIMEGLAR